MYRERQGRNHQAMQVPHQAWFTHAYCATKECLLRGGKKDQEHAVHHLANGASREDDIRYKEGHRP